MFLRRTICTGIVASLMASYSMVAIANAAPKRAIDSKRTSFRLGTQPRGASARGGGFTLCDPANVLVSESVDMVTVTPGNSVNCFSGTGTPEHSYGRSHDLSLGSTAGLALELSCVHFTMAQNSVSGSATV